MGKVCVSCGDGIEEPKTPGEDEMCENCESVEEEAEGADESAEEEDEE